MEASPHLRLVDADGVVHEVDPAMADLEDQVAGLRVTIDKQAREIGRLSRLIQAEDDPHSHPKGKEIIDLIQRWMQGTGHSKSKVSSDRVKLVKSRLKDDYSLEQLELAVDGISAFPYVVNGQRKQTGKASQRHDRLGICLGGGEKVEEFARLGWAARQQGWTIEEGWS